MKKNNFFASLFFLIFIFSCQDAYNIKQDGEFNQDLAVSSVSDMQLFLNEVYDRVSIKTQIGTSSVLTDEYGFAPANSGTNLNMYSFIVNSINSTPSGAGSVWSVQYGTINYVNRLISSSEKFVPSSPSDLVKYNSILAQAKAIRAFAFFQLLSYYSPDLKDDNAIGVILLDFVPIATDKLQRVNNKLIFDLIESDLAFADSNLPSSNAIANSSNYYFITKSFVNALRSRMYLYRGDYVQANTYADLAMTGLTMSDKTKYTGMWKDAIQGEAIFSLARPRGKETISDLFTTNNSTITGAAKHDMGRNLFNLLEEYKDSSNKNADIRRTAFVGSTSKISLTYQTDVNYITSDQIMIDKYPGKSGAATTNDLKVFRVSEMKLIKAEALVLGFSDRVGAAKILKEIREIRTGLTIAEPTYSSDKEALQDILKERRRELCYEGHRYIDLKRLGSLADVGIDRFSRDCEGIATCSIPVTDYRFTLPIPFSEVRANPTIIQNKDY
jgi:hypothetical protein